MEERISDAIISRFTQKLRNNLSVDAVIVGSGPSGLVAARELANAKRKVAVFERKLAPGGGVWGGGMLFNEIVVQQDVLEMLQSFGIRYQDAGGGFYTADSIETASALVYGALKAGATIFNGVFVEDIMMRNDRVCGVVINWAPVNNLGMHVDPLSIRCRAVLDATGHPSEIVQLAKRKAGLKLDSPDGGIVGERPMWVESGEASTVENTKRLYPGLYASGMAANNVAGGFRMGPIFGGMFLSGRKVANLILDDLKAEDRT